MNLEQDQHYNRRQASDNIPLLIIQIPIEEFEGSLLDFAYNDWRFEVATFERLMGLVKMTPADQHLMYCEDER